MKKNRIYILLMIVLVIVISVISGWDDFDTKKQLEAEREKAEKRLESSKKIKFKDLFNGKDLSGWIIYGTEKWYVEDGLLVCENCSAINGNIIEYGQEWRYYGPNDNKTSDQTRCGITTNSLLPNSSLGSVISTKYN